MPGLVFLGRRWSLASDDVPFLAAPIALFHGGWSIALVVLLAVLARPANCHDSAKYVVTIAGLLATFIASCALEVWLVWEGLKGSMFEMGKRWRMVPLLYAHLTVFLTEVGFLIYGTWVLYSPQPRCAKNSGPELWQPNGVMHVVIWTTWAIVFCMIALLALTFNLFPDYHAARSWEQRCRCITLLCCCDWRAQLPERDGRPSPVKRMGQLFSMMLGAVDLTPLDLLTAFLLAGQAQKCRRHRIIEDTVAYWRDLHLCERGDGVGPGTTGGTLPRPHSGLTAGAESDQEGSPRRGALPAEQGGLESSGGSNDPFLMAFRRSHSLDAPPDVRAPGGDDSGSGSGGAARSGNPPTAAYAAPDTRRWRTGPPGSVPFSVASAAEDWKSKSGVAGDQRSMTEEQAALHKIVGRWSVPSANVPGEQGEEPLRRTASSGGHPAQPSHTEYGWQQGAAAALESSSDDAVGTSSARASGPASGGRRRRSPSYSDSEQVHTRSSHAGCGNVGSAHVGPGQAARDSSHSGRGSSSGWPNPAGAAQQVSGRARGGGAPSAPTAQQAHRDVEGPTGNDTDNGPGRPLLLTPSGRAAELRPDIPPKEAAMAQFPDAQHASRADLIEASHWATYAFAAYGALLYIWSQPHRKGKGVLQLCCGHRGGVWSGALRQYREWWSRPWEAVKVSNHVNREAIRQMAGLHHSDLIFVRHEAEAADRHCLPYFIALDRHTSSVVLSIRGTLSLQDCITDILCEPAELDDWLRSVGARGDRTPANFTEAVPDVQMADRDTQVTAHSGILDAAKAVVADLQAVGVLRELLEKPPARGPLGAAIGHGHGTDCRGWRVLVTGHSLGAGAAVLVAVYLRNFYSNTRCWAVSPPGGVADPQVANEIESWCTSVVLGKDWIPRLTVDTFEKLRDEMVMAAVRCKVSKAAFLLRSLAGHRWRESELFWPEDDVAVRQDASAILRAYREAVQAVRGGPRDAYAAARRYAAPGKILFLRPVKPATAVERAQRRYYGVWITAQQLLGEGILVSPRMMADHMPDYVVGVLRRLAKRARAEVRMHRAAHPQSGTDGGGAPACNGTCCRLDGDAAVLVDIPEDDRVLKIEL